MELILNQSYIDSLFPFFICVGPDEKVLSYGRSAIKGFANLKSGVSIHEVFKIVSPKNFRTEQGINVISDKVISLKSITTELVFNGQILWVKEQKFYLFVVAPLIQDVEFFSKHNLTYADFSVYSPAFDFFVLTQAEKFARNEQSKVMIQLQNQISFSKLNLEIANHCSRCSSAKEMLEFVIGILNRSLGWTGSFEELTGLSNDMTLLFESGQILIPLFNQKQSRFLLRFKVDPNLKRTDYLDVFLNSMSHTLENTIQRLDQETSVREAQAMKVNSAKLATLGEMAAGIAHELNNPLAVIQGLAWLTLSQLDAPEVSNQKIRESMNKLIGMTERSSKIIKGLRVFARDGNEDPMEKIELNSIVEETLILCKSKTKNRGIELTWNPEGECFSLGRPVQISQVLLNLINNASDAIETSESPWINVELNQKKDYWEFSVTDSGNGIAPPVVEKMMSPFFTTKEPGKGTGLGLSISSSIIQSHGGELWYDKDSSNTCFRFTLPFFSDA